jgi:hypothetical protein
MGRRERNLFRGEEKHNFVARFSGFATRLLTRLIEEYVHKMYLKIGFVSGTKISQLMTFRKTIAVL